MSIYTNHAELWCMLENVTAEIKHCLSNTCCFNLHVILGPREVVLLRQRRSVRDFTLQNASGWGRIRVH